MPPSINKHTTKFPNGKNRATRKQKECFVSGAITDSFSRQMFIAH